MHVHYRATFDGPSNEAIVLKLSKEVKANNKKFDICDIRGLSYNLNYIATIRSYIASLCT